ncbi:hypothetical protein POM88_016455 [Heracleum sosnowskyi]|uniref:Uncharacterized protein n=1 Tax=Heracleum sosnowskyi TaxID=360622 RepID=A0AAD8MXE8_9APIA|nr:hypothetical protein POM88_016455 [Heracleum sosnowskyi]
MVEEDFRIQRQVVVEVRGLPCNAWTEGSLMQITNDIGTWGCWINANNDIRKGEPKENVETSQNESASSTHDLVWDFPVSLDRKENIIDVRVVSSQNSLCMLLDKVKIKGPGRPKKRKINRNPFEIRRRKLRSKTRKWTSTCIGKDQVLEGSKNDSNSEAEIILETAVKMGLAMKADMYETLRIIKEHIEEN